MPAVELQLRKLERHQGTEAERRPRPRWTLRIRCSPNCRQSHRVRSPRGTGGPAHRPYREHNRTCVCPARAGAAISHRDHGADEHGGDRHPERDASAIMPCAAAASMAEIKRMLRPFCRNQRRRRRRRRATGRTWRKPCWGTRGFSIRRSMEPRSPDDRGQPQTPGRRSPGRHRPSDEPGCRA